MKQIPALLAILRRMVFHAACALSTLVLLAALVGWVQSYRAPHALSYVWREPGHPTPPADFYDFTESHWTLFSSGGGLKFQLYRRRHAVAWFEGFDWQAFLPGSQFGKFQHVSDYAFYPPTHQLDGRWIGALYSPGPQLQLVVVVPHGVLAALAAILPWIWLRRFLRRRRTPAGGCLKCHYDLRAHHPGDRCPECGTMVATAPGAQIPLNHSTTSRLNDSPFLPTPPTC